MRNGKNGSKLLPVLVVILALILVACIGLLFWLEKGGELPARPSAPEKTTAGKQEVQTNPKPENTDPANTDNGTTGTLETSDVVIQTPYVDLRYPGEWSALLHTEVEENGKEYGVVFYARLDARGNVELFRIVLNCAPEKAFSNINAKDGKVIPVQIRSADIMIDDSWSDSEIQVAFGMQEALNYTLSFLPFVNSEDRPGENTTTEPPVTTDPPVTTAPPATSLPAVQTGDDMMIDTFYAQLQFPAKWADYLTLDIREDAESGGIRPYQVTFRCRIGGHDPVDLFIVHFGQPNGIHVTNLTTADGKTVEVRLTICNIQLFGEWTQEESRTVYAMQEDLNYLIQKLTGG